MQTDGDSKNHTISRNAAQIVKSINRILDSKVKPKAKYAAILLTLRHPS